MHTPPFSHAEPCPAHKQNDQTPLREPPFGGAAEGLRTVEGGHLCVVPGGLADVVAAVLAREAGGARAGRGCRAVAAVAAAEGAALLVDGGAERPGAVGVAFVVDPARVAGAGVRQHAVAVRARNHAHLHHNHAAQPIRDLAGA